MPQVTKPVKATDLSNILHGLLITDTRLILRETKTGRGRDRERIQTVILITDPQNGPEF